MTWFTSTRLDRCNLGGGEYLYSEYIHNLEGQFVRLQFDAPEVRQSETVTSALPVLLKRDG